MFTKHFATFLLISVLLFLIPSLTFGFGLENPADLAGEDTKFELVFPELTFQVENNLLNIEFLNADMTTESAKRYFLGRMESGVFKTNNQFDLGTRIAIGKFTFHTGLWARSSLNIMNGFTELFFYGYEPAKNYNLNGTRADALLALSCELSYARYIPLEINELQVGATLRLLEGMALYYSEVTDSVITTNEWGQAHYKFNVTGYQTSSENGFQGQGLLVDLGANYLMDQWKFGAVLKNLGPEMTWNNVDIVNNQYEGEFTGVEDEIQSTDSNTESNKNHTIRIPVALELGAVYNLNKNLSFTMGLGKAFNDGWGYSTTPRLIGGVDWKPLKFLRLAGQLSYQGTQIGIDTLTQLRIFAFWVNFELGWNGGLLIDNNTSGMRASLSTRLHF